MVASRLDYCESALAGLPDCAISKLKSVQNSAARLVSQFQKMDHITPVLKELYWLPVHQPILFKILVVTYKALHGLAPKYIIDPIKPYTPTTSLRLSAKQQFDVPRFKTRTYDAWAFSRFTPNEYNKLPLAITTAPTFSCFMSPLKTHLFISVFY